MSRTLLLLLAAITSACATYEREPNPFREEARGRVSETATYPARPPQLAEDGSNIEEVLEAATGNYTIARDNAIALERLSRAHNAVLDAAEFEHERSERRAEMLAEARRDRILTGWFWRLVGVLGLGAAINN